MVRTEPHPDLVLQIYYCYYYYQNYQGDVEEEDEDEGVSSQLTLQALAGNLQRMNSLWGPQEARLVRIGFWLFRGEGTAKQEESVRYHILKCWSLATHLPATQPNHLPPT